MSLSKFALKHRLNIKPDPEDGTQISPEQKAILWRRGHPGRRVIGLETTISMFIRELLDV
jgi:hypothetical protein